MREKKESRKNATDEGIAASRLSQGIVHHIDMNPDLIPSAYLDETEQLIGGLKKLNFYDSKFLYSIVGSHLLDALITTGSYRLDREGNPKETVYCLELGLNVSDQESLMDPMSTFEWRDYVDFGTDNGLLIAVYDSTLLTADSTGGRSEFRFTSAHKLDALTAIVVLDNY